MNLKKLQKATKILEEVKLLDAQIIELDRFAMLVVSGDTKCSFALTIENAPKEEVEKVGFDEDGSLKMGGAESYIEQMMKRYSYQPLLWGSSPTPSAATNTQTLNHKLEESGALSILGILLGEKQVRRDKLLNQLKDFGFNL